MANGTDTMRNGNNGLGMTTWPLKVEKRKKSGARPPRPRTATLERPLLLDIAFLEKVDMSLVRKELLNISNLCRPSARKRLSETTNHNVRPNPQRKRASVSMQHLKVPSSDESWRSETIVRNKNRKNLRLNMTADSDSSALSSPKYRTDSNYTIATGENSLSPRSQISGSTDTTIKGLDSDCEISTLRKRGQKNNKLLSNKTPREVFSVPHLKQHIPEPCKTCGRNDLPERFHSHGRNGSTTGNVSSIPTASLGIGSRNRNLKRSTLQQNNKSPSESVSTAATPRASPRLAKSQTSAHQTSPLQSHREAHKLKGNLIQSLRPRTLTCYLCGREFGTASLHLHEPRCRERWERENAYLPAHLRRPMPEKPPANLSALEYNNMAWKVSQKSLLPCEHCGRTFLPDRLEIHLRSCKPQKHQTTRDSSIDPGPVSGVSSSCSAPAQPVASVSKCIVCERAVTSRSLAQHEAQCLAAWRRRNDQLPESERRPEPRRRRSLDFHNDDIKSPSRNSSDSRLLKSPLRPNLRKDGNKILDEGKNLIPANKTKLPLQLQRWRKPQAPPRPWALECYLCGVELPTSEINAHEEMCAEDWRRHNELLPKDKQEKEPRKPDTRFTSK
ncbi:uncharacterized protein LOC113366807 [Ctenocephalides felis]|uniref:uncharacterized protein LOC113366807 n=1 Tax=Ctenocephalides felis TaxID=7515 RepID=UPI000E6E4A67|nr:uncharacterized protein LOC113366807 [Ctenocephalides felis]